MLRDTFFFRHLPVVTGIVTVIIQCSYFFEAEIVFKFHFNFTLNLLIVLPNHRKLVWTEIGGVTSFGLRKTNSGCQVKEFSERIRERL